MNKPIDPSVTESTVHDCCSTDSGCTLPEPSASPAKAPCPSCKNRSGKVDPRAVDHLVRDEARERVGPGQHYFCPEKDCDIVWFEPVTGQRFTRADVSVRVGVKETEDPIPVCYCFGHSKGEIREEIRATGKTTVVDSIRREIQAGNCACERENPSGKCCLGEVTRVVKELEGEAGDSCGTDDGGCCC